MVPRPQSPLPDNRGVLGVQPRNAARPGCRGNSSHEGKEPVDETEALVPGPGPRRDESGRCLRRERGGVEQSSARWDQHPSTAVAVAGRRHAAHRLRRTPDLVDAAGPLIAQVWAVRHGVETGASLRFAALSQGMRAAGAPATLVELAARASADEVRHAAHCADILRSRQADVPPPETRLLFFGPRDLGPEQRLTYEVVAESGISDPQ